MMNAFCRCSRRGRALPSAAPSHGDTRLENSSEVQAQKIQKTASVSNPSQTSLPSAFAHERALENGGCRQPFAIFTANQQVCMRSETHIGTTHLVRFKDGNSPESTAMTVLDLITKQRQRRQTSGIITFSESWTDEALRCLSAQHDPNEVKLAALSYANCSYVGGNYSDGGMTRAQEEELCRRFPAMFESLQRSAAGSQKALKREMIAYKEHVFGARFEDGYSKARNVLFVEEIECMRHDALKNYKLLQPKHRTKSGFVIAAAPLLGRGRDRSFTKWLTEPAEWYEKLFLNVFLAPKSIDLAYDIIVVGPIGCGAFGNDPTIVAQSFLNVIRNHDILHLYREVHFCLGRSTGRTVGGANVNNAEVFRRELEVSGFQCTDISKELDHQVSIWNREEEG